jgi:hypothetical protein
MVLSVQVGQIISRFQHLFLHYSNTVGKILIACFNLYVAFGTDGLKKKEKRGKPMVMIVITTAEIVLMCCKMLAINFYESV